MSRPADLTEFARTGYFGNDNCHLATSPTWYAHALGRYLHDTGRSTPSDVRMSRGDSIRSGGMLFKFRHTSPGVVSFERQT